MKNKLKYLIGLGAFGVLVLVAFNFQLDTVGHVKMAALAKAVETEEIAMRADNIPPQITRTESDLVVIELYTEELVAEMSDGVTYQYWTYNGTVPGPFIRVREGDDVEIRLRHGTADGEMDMDHEQMGLDYTPSIFGIPTAEAAGGHDDEMSAEHGGHSTDEHAAAGHSFHSIDLHAVIGPGGGGEVTQVADGDTKVFRFKAERPGIYVYHCASPHVPTHVANGMYGMILVEPAKGMSEVDKEFYVMQGEFYTEGEFGEPGHQEFDKAKLLDEKPSYFLFNGRVGALTGDTAMRAKVGDKIRMYVGVGTNIAANFHIVGGVFDSLYQSGAITSEPLKDVQTTLIPAGSATMIEFTIDVPGKYLLVDHSLTRTFDKGALAELIVEGPERPDLYMSMD